jgi:hypothetical protein
MHSASLTQISKFIKRFNKRNGHGKFTLCGHNLQIQYEQRLFRLNPSFRNSSLFTLKLSSTILKIVRDIFGLLASRYNPWCVNKEIVHFFEGQSGCLWHEEPEENGIGKVADLNVATNQD